MIELPLFNYHPKSDVKSMTSHSEQMRMYPGKKETGKKNVN